MPSDDELIQPIPLPADAVTAHLAIVVQALNSLNRNVGDLRTETRASSNLSHEQFTEVRSRLVNLESRPHLTLEQHQVLQEIERERRAAEASQHAVNVEVQKSKITERRNMLMLFATFGGAPAAVILTIIAEHLL